MGGGLLQLVALGYENLYLTDNPQITFFKVVYRRHTNFSIEPIQHKFQSEPTFGDRVSCVISRNADLAGNMYIVVKLPAVGNFTDNKNKFAWVRRIGFALIKQVEIEINGRVIDRHYAEWLNIWAELTGDLTSNNKDKFNNMIGNIPELYDFTDSKQSYQLWIPLYFWFCRGSGNAIPIVSLQYSDIKINVEFEEAKNCYLLGPSHFIKCQDDLVSFTKNEYLEQTINGITNSGIFLDFDPVTKYLYYYQLTGKFISYLSNDTNETNESDDIDEEDYINNNFINLLKSNETEYKILGKSSGYSTYVEVGSSATTYTTLLSSTIIRNINFDSAFIVVDYYYLDEDERYKFAQAKHDYIIEQLFYTPSTILDNISHDVLITVDNPCKLMVWITQLASNYTSKDYFNYTDTYQRKLFSSDMYDVKIGDPVGSSLIKEETILFNGMPRLSMRTSDYFDKIQIYQHTNYDISTGINMYSFGLYPLMTQPSGTCNMSQISDLTVSMKLTSKINERNKALFRAYCLTYGVLRIINGLAAPIFIK